MWYCCHIRLFVVGTVHKKKLYAVIPLGCVWVLLFLVWSSFFLLLSLASPFGCFILFVAAVVADAALRSLFLYGRRVVPVPSFYTVVCSFLVFSLCPTWYFVCFELDSYQRHHRHNRHDHWSHHLRLFSWCLLQHSFSMTTCTKLMEWICCTIKYNRTTLY